MRARSFSPFHQEHQAIRFFVINAIDTLILQCCFLDFLAAFLIGSAPKVASL